MLTPADLVALFSATGGSFYGAAKKAYWPDTYEFRLVVGLQTSTIFLLAFASLDYITPPGGGENVLQGVAWTAPYLTTALPVFVYLVIMLLLLLGTFHAATFLVSRLSPDILKSHTFAIAALVLYLLVGYHALTLEVIPVNSEYIR